MDERRIDFEKLKWETPHPGMKQKIYNCEGECIRLVEFSEDFVEENWCLNRHIGVVLEGEMDINFNAEVVHYRKGDGIWTAGGQDNKHKVLIAPGQHVRLLLFENNRNTNPNQ